MMFALTHSITIVARCFMCTIRSASDAFSPAGSDVNYTSVPAGLRRIAVATIKKISLE